MTSTGSVWSTYERPSYLAGESQNTGANPEPISETDVCVIGTGIAGLTAAYQLTRAGREVILIGAHPLAGGETAGTTAQINTMHDDNWYEMEKIHGLEKIRLCAQSYRAALEFIETTSKELNSNCSFERLPNYILADNKDDPDWLQNEYQAAKRAGIENIEIVGEVPGLETSNRPALMYKDQAQFHPLVYCADLAKAITASGRGRIMTGLYAIDVDETQDEARVILRGNRSIICRHAILATNVPFHQRLIPIEALAPYRSYVIAIPVERDSLPRVQYSDNLDPYHYVRLVRNDRPEYNLEQEFDLLLIGGEDHRVGEEDDPESRFGLLYNWCRDNFGLERQILYRWSAQTIETFDGIPLLGRLTSDTSRIHIITGDSGMGMTHGTLGGLLCADNVLGKTNLWSEVYSPRRSRTKSTSRWASENADSVSQYRDWFTPGDVDSEDEILPGHGAIIREGLSKVAVFKDQDGTCSRYSAVCPHLKGIVRWNNTERSFDCPAHGSRFNEKGELLHGPAHCGLKRLS